MKKSVISEVMRAFGKKGGPARAKALSPARRRAIARMGGRAKAKNLLDSQKAKA